MAEPAARWRRLAAQVRRPAPRQGCHTFSEQLPLFVSDELAGYDVDTLYALLAAHLDLCPRCLQEYGNLSAMLRAALYSANEEQSSGE